ncbi:puromycin-sensitive aminopeptidase-like protein, partial [Leptotrombidium deliense]
MVVFLILVCIFNLLTGGQCIKGRPDYGRSLPTKAECGRLVNGHLPKTYEPTHYKMTIKFDHSNSTFSGYEIINVKLVNNTNKITMHARDINVEEVCFVQDDRYLVPETRYCKTDETVTFTFEKNLTTGFGDLKILFRGSLNEKFFGLYKVKCKRCKKTEFINTLSQFAFISARRAFPCFDEPHYRTTFQVKLIAVKNATILSNMPEASDAPYGENELNMHKVIFTTTPKMSTYLLAFVIGNYDFVESKSKDNNVVIRVYTPKGKKDEGKYALNVALQVLEFFQTYFEIIFPLPKLDIIANPTLPVKAAENWGIIIFRESSLLFERNTSSIDIQMDIWKNVAYEVARQWIGNLVSMDSWSEIWLQEGLATLMAYVCNDALHPEWHVWHRFIYEELAVALRIDALKSSYPLEMKSADFQASFDDIMLKKGAAVLRMLLNWIGADVFRKGVRLFLQKHKYDHANTTDFLLAMREVSKEPVDEVMMSWITQKGYPLVKIDTCESCETFNVSQRKFTLKGAKTIDDDNSTWNIPVTYSTRLDSNKGKSFILRNVSATVKSEIKEGFGVIIKSGCSGFYRVQYPKNVSNYLFGLVKTMEMNAEIRFCLQNDFFALAKVGIESIVDYLKYLQNYKNETELFIWNSIESSLTEISS